VGDRSENPEMNSYMSLRHAWVAGRPLTIDSGVPYRREHQHRDALRTLVTRPGEVLERHRRDVQGGADVVTTATWGIAAASCLSPDPDRWMTVARRAVRLARLAIAAQRRVGQVAVAFSIDAAADLADDGRTVDRLARSFAAEAPDLVILEARCERQPALERIVRSLDATRLPVWLSLPRVPRSIEWLEERGRRTRLVDPGLLEITRW
jgi:hypothetical protein